jgi:hypothetical protein
MLANQRPSRANSATSSTMATDAGHSSCQTRRRPADAIGIRGGGAWVSLYKSGDLAVIDLVSTRWSPPRRTGRRLGQSRQLCGPGGP